MAGAQPRTSCRSLFKQLRDFTCPMPTHTFIKELHSQQSRKFSKKNHLNAILKQDISTIFID